MASPKRALIIGGSIGGLFAGHLLRKAGWDVTIFERSGGDLADRGAGLGISAEILDVMRSIGLRISRSYAFQVRGSIWLGQKNEIVHESGRAANGSAWSIIYLPLRAAFPAEHYRTGMHLTAVVPEPDGVTAIFSDGARVRGDLLIAADGVFSTVRRQLMPGVEPRSAGYIAWRGLLDEKDLPPDLPPFILERCSFSFPEGEQVVSLPVPGTGNDQRPGHRRYYFIWYRSAGPALQKELFTDASGRSHGVSIPPPLIRPEFIAEMKSCARRNLAPVLADIVTRVPQPLLQSIADMEAPKMVFGRVALLGDSAFVARPHVVAGTTKAALDAKGLVDALDASGDDIDAALQRYERERRDFGHAIVSHSRYLGTYLEGQLKPVSERSADELHRDPKKIMHDYGAPHLVHDVKFTELDD
jgi:2-polyprenyl-6-methoxyphenol hydroxylase-like FAD-dependent oxidoreductase